MHSRSDRSSAPPRAAARGGGLRIIGGKWKRTTIAVADVTSLRPTPDRVRETLFNWLSHYFGGALDGLSALDLFAGSGALGFEAASRGAARVVLVENNAAAVRRLEALRDKLAATCICVRAGDALQTAEELERRGERFDMIFLDPPFRAGWMQRALPAAAALCASSGLVYAEAEAALDDAALASVGLESFRADKAGEVFYHLLRRENES